ncbi:unnamed protein product [Schistosoma mattheei]|uniref:Reverse transcriptase domain-containing protein n=1 Tax=Schistosoma mattheei TaxID=31246 RepID=A0A3P8CZR5_9TREM|nr:unnamed protein product [Schistosoma mattheei]
MLNSMKDCADAQLRNQQAGFRKDRSCTDQIGTLRIIVEQSIEWNSSLYINFIDYEKAFDGMDRTTLRTEWVNRHEKNEQELDGTRKEGPGQSGLENAGQQPMLHGNGDRHEKNEQELDGIRKEGPGQRLENAGQRPMLHWE